MSLEILFGVIYLVAAAVALWSLGRLNRFLADTPSIADNVCLQGFKALARVQMYLALLMIVLLMVGMGAGIGMVARHGRLGFVVVVFANALVFGLGMYHKKIEVRTRTLQAAAALAQEYQRVSESWVKKALPDF